MITNKKELKEYILSDAKANNRSSKRPRILGDETWKFQLSMRKLDYYTNRHKSGAFWLFPHRVYYNIKYHRQSVRLGFTIPYYIFGKGLSIPHYGSIVINAKSRFGENCKIHNCVNVGSTSGVDKAPVVGNNVYIGPGVKLVGDITIADGVCIGAGAVVVKSITEPNTTWAGCPAKKISDKSSYTSLSPLLFDGKEF